MRTETLPIDRIQQALDELEAQKSLITNCFLRWKNLSDHCASLEKTIANGSQSLDSKLESLESETKTTLDSIEQRESSIPHRETTAAKLIADRRAAVLAEIENPDSRPPRNLNSILRWYCRRMDSPGLWRFMVTRRRELENFRHEFLEAVAETVDPSHLVLGVVEDFLSNPTAADSAVSHGGELWAVGVLVKALLDLVEKKSVEISESMRNRAAATAENWRVKYVGRKRGAEEKEEETIEVGDKLGMEGAEGRIFVRLVIAFGLKTKFEEDFLLKLIVENGARKEMAKHASRLGFGAKVEELIELVKNGKEIDAIYFAHESGLLDKFSPVSLLKYYLQSSQKNTTIMRKRYRSASFVKESNKQELHSLRTIIKCVETLDLEAKFSLDNLRKRAVELESITQNKDRKTTEQKESKEHQTRRPRSRPSKYRSSKPFRSSKTFSPYPRNPPNYGVPMGFDVYPPAASYAAAAHRAPAMPQFYAADNNAYGGPSSINYGLYDHNAAPVIQPQYQH